MQPRLTHHSEAAAIPYVSVCGKPEYAPIRLTLAQALQATGTVTALVIASYCILDDIPGKEASSDEQHASLLRVQWIYLGIAIAVFALAFAIFFAPIPEVSDDEMEQEAKRKAETRGELEYETKPFRKQYKLFFGIFAAFNFFGSQTCLTTFFLNYATEVKPSMSDKDAAHRLAIAQAVFAGSRFVSSLLLIKIKPKHLLLGAVTAAVAFLAAAVGTTGNTGIAFLILEFLSKSCVFPITFTITTANLGRHTKRGGSWLVASLGSGAVWPPAMGAVADRLCTQKAMVVALAAVTIGWTYPVYLNLCKPGVSEEAQEVVVKNDEEQHSANNADTKEEVATIQGGFEKFCEGERGA